MTTTQPQQELSVSSTDELRSRARRSLENCGVDVSSLRSGPSVRARSPITGEELFDVPAAGEAEVEEAIAAAKAAFAEWRTTPAPVRGALVKRLGALMTEHKADVAELVTIEAGKITSEALGEVQEMIDICDFAVGLSRQLEGRTMPSERPEPPADGDVAPAGRGRPDHRVQLPGGGVVVEHGGRPGVRRHDRVEALDRRPRSPRWRARRCWIALLRTAARRRPCIGWWSLTPATASALVDSPDVALVSATGSERMGEEIAPRVAARMGRALLELGGNNAAVVAPSADLELARRAIVFAAAGTAGPALHDAAAGDRTRGRRRRARRRSARSVRPAPIGDPSADGTLVGPLINEHAYRDMADALEQARADGGELIVGGGRRDAADFPNAYYVEPAIVRMPTQTELVRRETFAPILYVMTLPGLRGRDRAPQRRPPGLSSSIFTRDQREAERFLAADGSDCGIVNVNIGTSGAEIGGAFGGEKSTGGGRESGSDAWRAYMRRATNTINYSDELPLAQGVEFG